MTSAILLQKSVICERCNKLFDFNKSFNKCLWIGKVKEIPSYLICYKVKTYQEQRQVKFSVEVILFKTVEETVSGSTPKFAVGRKLIWGMQLCTMLSFHVYDSLISE